jgi:peptide/nickel transport system substrate-binding protein
MKYQSRKKFKILKIALLVILLFMTGCGGGSDDEEEPTSAPPSPATTAADVVPTTQPTQPPEPTADITHRPSIPTGEPTQASTAASQNVLVIGLDDAVITLDPADYSHRQTETIIRNMFDGLVTRTRDGQVVLEIAESYRWVDDRTLEFVIRQGITFHNGEPLSADDVQFTFERIIAENGIEHPEPHTSPRQGLVGPLESVQAVDEYTVHFNFASPWPVALQMFVHQHIIPHDYFAEVGNEGFVSAPVGCGPFKFVSAKLDEEIVLERFDGYYGGAPDLPPVGPALVESVIFRVLPDAAARVEALQAGQVDIIQSVPSYLVPILEADPNVMVQSAPGTRPFWMEMNVHKPPFDDVRVRQAMNYAIDVDLIVSAFLGGRGTVISGPLSPFNQMADRSLQPYGYDQARAIELLVEAGYTAQDISFVIDCRESDQQYAEAVATQLRELGMDVSVQVGDYAELKPSLIAGERVAFVGGWGDSAFDPVGHFEAKWHTWVEGTSYGRGNFSTYSNPRVDELIQAGEVELDPEQRQQIYYEAQQTVYQEAPAVFLFLPDAVEASSARVQDWSPSPDGRLNMHDVWLEP